MDKLLRKAAKQIRALRTFIIEEYLGDDCPFCFMDQHEDGCEGEKSKALLKEISDKLRGKE